MIDKTIARQIISDLSRSVNGNRAAPLYDYIDDITEDRDELQKQLTWKPAGVKPNNCRGVLCAGKQHGIPLFFFGSWVEEYGKWSVERDAEGVDVECWIDIPGGCPVLEDD